MIDDSQISPRRAALVAALRHSALLILVLTALGAAAGTGVGLQRAEEHTAEASILVSPLEGNPFYPSGRGDDLINLETEAQVVGSDPVARDVATRIRDSVSTASLLDGLEVTVPANTQILTIQYTADSDSAAVERAQAFADAFLDYRKARSEQVVRSRTERIQSQIDAQNKTLASLVARSTVEQNTARKNLLQEQIRGVTAQIAQLGAQLAELQTGTVDPGQVITPASVVGDSVFRGVVVYALIGALAGLLLALAVVVVRARAENRLHHSEDVDSSGLPLLGSVSMNEVLATNAGIVSLDSAGDFDIGSGLQNLRVSVLSRERRRPVRILYAAAADGSRYPRTALGLAYAAAASSLTTVLVDATGGAGDITRLLELESSPGFSDVLSSDISLDRAMTQVTDHLHVIPAGRPDPRADDLLTGPRMSTIFQDIANIADIVIIATGPLRSSRSQALAIVTDVIVVEAVESQSRLGDLVAIADDPTLAGSVLGVVFVGRPRSRPRKTSEA